MTDTKLVLSRTVGACLAGGCDSWNLRVSDRAGATNANRGFYSGVAHAQIAQGTCASPATND